MKNSELTERVTRLGADKSVIIESDGKKFGIGAVQWLTGKEPIDSITETATTGATPTTGAEYARIITEVSDPDGDAQVFIAYPGEEGFAYFDIRDIKTSGNTIRLVTGSFRTGG